MMLEPNDDLMQAGPRARFINKLVFLVIGMSPTDQGLVLRPLIDAARATTPALADDAAFEQWETELALEVIARLEQIGAQAADGIAGRA